MANRKEPPCPTRPGHPIIKTPFPTNYRKGVPVSQSRIEQYQAFLDKDPNNSFARYVIAQEHMKAGDHARALAEYDEIISRDPDYVAAYHHSGKALETVDDQQGARARYRQGIEAADRVGNGHARAELVEALGELS